MNPRIYNFSSIDPKTGKPTTSKHRQDVYRRAKKLGMTMPEYRKHQDAEFKRLYAFLYIKDYGKAAVAFKRAMQEVHPDHGGDPEQAQRLILAWDDYKKRQGWSGRAPTVTPPAEPKRGRFSYKRLKATLAALEASETPTVTVLEERP